jgi:hypothetical protein
MEMSVLCIPLRFQFWPVQIMPCVVKVDMNDLCVVLGQLFRVDLRRLLVP